MQDSSEDERSASNDEFIEEQPDLDDKSRANIREKVSTMSFEDLQKLKNEIGSKLYNQAVFGVDKQENRKTTFKRANKNRPREMSSKLRRVKVENPVIRPVKTQVCRDPRFDPLCGEFDKKIFKGNYKFVNDIRVKEKMTLEKQMEETVDVNEKKKIKHVVQRLGNQIREYEKKEVEQRLESKEKEEIKEKIKHGEKPQYKRRSVKRLEGLINKYEELKKTNKLQKHIEKRSKKLSVKDRRKMERQNLSN